MIRMSPSAILILVSTLSLGLLCLALGYRIQRKYPVSFIPAYVGHLASSVVYGLLNWTGVVLISGILMPGSAETLKVALVLVTLALPFLVLRVVLLLETVLRWTHVRPSSRRTVVYALSGAAALIVFAFAAVKLFSRPDAEAFRSIDWLGTAAIIAQYLAFGYGLFARDAKNDVLGLRGLRAFAGTSLLCFSAYVLPAFFAGQSRENVFRVLLPILYFAVLIPPLLVVERFLGHHASRLIDMREADEGLSLLADEYRLSPRERDIVRLILGGKTNKEIAAELFISPHTVKNATSRIYEKIGVQSRGQLAGRFIKK